MKDILRMKSSKDTRLHFLWKDERMSEKKKKIRQIAPGLLFFAFFGSIGFFGAYFGADFFNLTSYWNLFFIVIVVFISFPIHVILHELGHILGGFASGYRFIMFRLFGTVWIKTDQGISKRKEYVPGIMGQALMIPPETNEHDEPPFLLYHMSGLLMNIFTAVLFVVLGKVLSIKFITYFLYISAFTAVLLAITSAIPLRGTDGYNIAQHFKHEATLTEITDILYMYSDMVKGASLEELQKYVDLDTFTNFKNPNAATIYSLRASYLFERKDYEGACEIYELLYENLEDLFEGHRPIIIVNYLYALLLTDPRDSEISKIIQSKPYKQFQKIKQSDYIRIYAAKSLYYDQDLVTTEILLNEGEKYIHLSPTLTDENFEETMYQYLREDLKAAGK